MNAQPGRLWVVATPIGNLDDLSGRAAEILREVPLVAAEDTRHSAPLLARIGSRARTMALHEHNADFACWCSYKYLNSGPGGIGGAFVHERHFGEDLPRFAGWWGHDKEERFKMERTFKPIPTAEAWQLSNAPVFAMAPHRAALDIFDEAGMDRLIAKSRELTGYLETTIDRVAEATGSDLEIITPRDPEQRGCQLSVVLHGEGRALFDELTRRGVVADWREPNVIRLAPVPLYNGFQDVWRFGEVLKECQS